MIEYGEQSRAAAAALDKLRVSNAERARIRRFEERYRIYCDDYQDLITAEVKRVFVNQERATRVAILGDATINPLRRVIEETYAYPGAARRFERADGSADPVFADETLQEDLDVLHGEGSACLGGFNDAVYQCLPARDGADGRPLGLPMMRLFYPHEVTVTADEYEPGKIAEVRYLHIRPNGEEVVIGWSADEHWLEGANGSRHPAPGATTTANPYGWLPFVAAHDGRRDSAFWDEMSGEGLVAFTLQHGRDWASFNFKQQQQSYLQLHVDGVASDWPGFSDIGVGSLLTTSGNVKINVLDLQADLDGDLAKLKTQLMLAFKSYGLDADRYFNPGQTPSSGISRRIEREDLLERRKRIRPFLKKAEREFAELYRRAYNWNGRKVKIDESAVFRLCLNEEPVVQSPDEIQATEKGRLENLKTVLDMGLRTEAEVVAEYRGISAQDAEEFIANRDAAEAAKEADDAAEDATEPPPAAPAPPADKAPPAQE